jgi:hypothetical protein
MKKTKSLAGRRRSKDEPNLNKRKSSTAGAAHITQSNMFYLHSSPAKVELQDWFLQSMVPFFALLVILLLSVVAYELPHGQSGSLLSTSNETFWKEPASFVAHE